ncbi:MAG TPA: thiolase family protein [Acidimicrobiales bacterium]|nr:thiolase family protein [Acidimicrobiales bacterium]
MAQGLRGDAVVAGFVERRAERRFTGTPRLGLEQWADLAADVLADAGIAPHEVDGLCCGGDPGESSMFVPATIAEYCGWKLSFAERVDLGGASPVGMVWRAAAAIELGACEVVVCAASMQPRPAPPRPQPVDARVSFGASSNAWGSPQAEFDIPYGNLGQNCGYAMYAERYHDQFGWDERSRAKIVADQRVSACANPDAVWFGHPVTVDDVLASPMIADPLHMLEIVMPCNGGAALVVTTAERARHLRHRPVAITGFGEYLTHKTPTYAPDLTTTPVGPAAKRAFAMAGITPADVDMVELYDCYSITVMLSIEDSGFCGKGEGMAFVRDHDLSYRGDFPCNTHGGQLGFGQAGLAGGMSQVVEAVRQVQGRAGDRQLARHDIAYVSGTGGIMSEQAALVLRGL